MHLPQKYVSAAEEDVQLSQRERIHKFHQAQRKNANSNLYLFPESQLPEMKVVLLRCLYQTYDHSCKDRIKGFNSI